MTGPTEFPEGERLPLDLGADLTARLRARAAHGPGAVSAGDWQTLQKQDPAARRDGGERRRAPGGGRKAKLDLADRVLATVLQQNLALPPTVLAHLFAVSKDTIRHTTSEIRRLMDQHAHTPRPPAAHLNTVAGLLVHAAAHGVTLTTETAATC